jgi:hypothetical protein
MKINKKYLEKIIKEEISRMLTEMDSPRVKMLHEFFLDLFRAYTNSIKIQSRKVRLRIAGMEDDYKKVLEDGMKDLGMNASDLYDELLDNFQDKIDNNMFVTLRDILEQAMLADDEDFRIGTEDKEDMEKGMYDRFKNYHGRPDIRLVDKEEEIK